MFRNIYTLQPSRMTKEAYSLVAPTIPHQPGVYKYFNEGNVIIYIGKAKDLRKRVNSYFYKNNHTRKTILLVQQIHRIEFTIVSTEQDALLLESSLIKHFQPKYNIALRDDKSYPHIVIKKEEFPRVFVTRRILKDGSTYLGPYVNVNMVYELMDVIKQSMPLRSCNLPLTQDAIAKGKFKACLEYQIGNCKAPCIAAQSHTDYNWYIQEVKEILKGKLGNIKKRYTQEMLQYAQDLQFEKAEILKKKLQFLQEYTSKSVIVSTTIDDVDVASISSNETHAFVNYMGVFNGTIVNSKTVEIQKKLEETDEEILSFVLHELREKFGSKAKEIISPLAIDGQLFGATIVVPKLGDKKKLLELSQQNVQYFMQELKRQKSLKLEQAPNYIENTLLALQQGLRMRQLPVHIECFDNSNFQGSYPVAAMVCFKQGLPSKKDYRHFHIKTVEGINDFASMKEIVYRRYKRLSEEGLPLPQLVVIDGGKGQLGAAMEAITELNLLGKMTIVGLAKRVEEIFFPGDSESIQLPYGSEQLKLLTRVRDEVHRFGITFHRDTRSKGVVKNELENIQGIGEKTATQLLQKFRSVKQLKQKTENEIADVIGPSKAAIVYQSLHAAK